MFMSVMLSKKGKTQSTHAKKNIKTQRLQKVLTFATMIKQNLSNCIVIVLSEYSYGLSKKVNLVMTKHSFEKENHI